MDRPVGGAPCYGEPMSKQPTPKQRRSQRGSVEDRWRKRIKDADGNSVEVASAVAGQVTRWRARYVDDAGREHTRHFDRKVEAQQWLDKQLAALLRGDHVAPSDAKMTVGEWCDKWLAGYGTRRASTVRQAEVHVKIIKAHFGSVPMSAIKPSDVRAWTVDAQEGGESRLLRLRDLLAVLPDLHRRRPRRDRRAQPVFAADLAGHGQAAALRGHDASGVGAVRRGAALACGPRSCSAPTPGCGSPKRRRCGSPTSTSPPAS